MANGYKRKTNPQGPKVAGIAAVFVVTLAELSVFAAGRPAACKIRLPTLETRFGHGCFINLHGSCLAGLSDPVVSARYSFCFFWSGPFRFRKQSLRVNIKKKKMEDTVRNNQADFHNIGLRTIAPRNSKF